MSTQSRDQKHQLGARHSRVKDLSVNYHSISKSSIHYCIVDYFSAVQICDGDVVVLNAIPRPEKRRRKLKFKRSGCICLEKGD